MKVKDKILQLRSEGKSYREIKQILGCSSSTISYHCGEGQKQKNKIRTAKFLDLKSTQHYISQKIYRFVNRSKKDSKNYQNYKTKIHQRISNKISDFNRRTNKMRKCDDQLFSLQDILDIYNKYPRCNLTGRTIELENTKSWELDHIIPISKGGSNELNNCQITCREANYAKGDLTMHEFISLCKDVLIHNGYQISKSQPSG